MLRKQSICTAKASGDVSVVYEADPMRVIIGRTIGSGEARQSARRHEPRLATRVIRAGKATPRPSPTPPVAGLVKSSERHHSTPTPPEVSTTSATPPLTPPPPPTRPPPEF